jgi:hypothetical protein
LEVTLSKDDTSEIDETLKKGPSAGPEEYFRLGQLVPNAATIGEAISALYSLPAQELEAAAEAFKDAAPRPYQGSIVDPKDLPALLADQIPVLPLYRNVPSYRGDPRILADFYWFNLEALKTHPQREAFRDRTGHDHPRMPREVPFQAFLTHVCRLDRPDWVETLIFADEPYEKPVEDDQRLQPKEPDLYIRFTVAYVRAPFEGSRDIPSWITSVIDAFPEHAARVGSWRA